MACVSLAIISAVMMLAWSFAVPVFEAPDEGAHWKVARFLHDRWRWPYYDSSMVEANQSPLYHILIAPFAAASPVPPTEVMVTSNGGVVPIRPPRFYLVEREDLFRYWPIRFCRFATIILSLATVVFTFLCGLEMTQRVSTGVLAASAVAFLPQFSFRGMNISNDGMVAATGALATYLIIRGARRDFGRGDAVRANLAIAAATYSKISALAFYPVYLLAALLTRGTWINRLSTACLLVLAIALLVPWMTCNYALYGDVLATKQMYVAVPELIDPKPITSPYFTDVFPPVLARSFVGVFGGMNLYMPEWVYKLYGGVAAISCVGLVVGLIRNRIRSRLVLLLSVIPLVCLAMTIHLNLTFTQPQGRYLFPGLASMAVLAAIGMQNLPKWNHLATAALIGIVASVNVFVLFQVIIPAYWN